MGRLQAAVIGLGFVGRAHVEALRRLGVPLRGLLDDAPERTRRACQALGVDRGYASLEELLADGKVDVVHLCTPNHLHSPMARAALEAGKDMVCEKPLAMNTRESAALASLAAEAGRVGAVNYNLRYYPLCQEARALVRQGAIGEPRLVHGSYLQDWLLYPSDWNWRLEPELGGELRAVADIGTHWLDMATWITGRRVLRVCADLATVVPARRRPRGVVETFQTGPAQDQGFDEIPMRTDDYASVLLGFEGGLRGAVTVSQVSPGRKNRLWLEIDGSEGSLAWDGESPNLLWLGRRREPNRLLIKDPALMTPEARPFAAYPGGHAEGYPDTFVQLYKAVYGYIEAGDLAAPRTFPTFETGHEAMALCEAIAASARERRWVDVEGEAGRG